MASPESEPLIPASRSGGGADPPGPVVVSWSHTPNMPPGKVSEDLSEDEGHSAKEAWKATALGFVAALRLAGIDVDVDEFDWSTRGVDWTQWGRARIRAWPCTLVVVNAAWRACYEGDNAPTEGAGAAAEARELHGMFTRHQDDHDRRVVPVVLPGASEDDVPNQLRPLQRRVITDVSPAGVQDLVHLLTGQPVHPIPPLGLIPVLPTAVRERIEQEPAMEAAVLSGTSELSATSEPHVAGHVALSGTGTLTATSELPATPTAAAAALSATSELRVGDEERSRLQKDAAVVDAALRWLAMPSSPADLGQGVPTSAAAREDERRRLQVVSALLKHVLADDDHRPLASTWSEARPSAQLPVQPPPLAHPSPEEQLTDLWEQVTAGLELANRCWVTLAAVLDPPTTPTWAGAELSATRARREQMVTTWAQAVPVPANNPSTVLRDAGRVIFSGAAPSGQGPARVSEVWRAEIGDSARGVAAGLVSDDVQLVPGTGSWYQSTARGIEPEIYLPVRQEMLELWLLCQLQLLTEALADGLITPHTTMRLPATLLSPAQLTHQLAHNPQGQRLPLVSERRDEDGHRLDDATVSGSTELPTGRPITTDVVNATVAELQDPAALVGAARRLTIGLVEHFSAETTVVLRLTGTANPLVDPLSAPEALQQLVHQHARALGLRVDGLSPADRRRLADEHRARARAVLRR